MKVQAFVIHKDEFTIYSSGKGGAVISDKVRAVAERKFNEAMHLVYAVRTLMNYAATGIFEKTPKLEIEYTEI